MCSPILGNIYLHYALDTWFEDIVRTHSKGAAYMVRYADDSVFCFQYEEDAKRFYRTLIKRLAKYNLEVAEEKTKLIKLNKVDDDDNDGNGNMPDKTFDFLGFTHYVGKDKDGRKRVKRKTSKKKYKASLLKFKIWIQENRHIPTKELMKKLNAKVIGNMRYYGITDNHRAVSNFVNEIMKLLYKWLNRRSQRKSLE